MGNEHNDGGPAFPQHQRTGVEKFLHDKAGEGLSLRDYFAGQALAGINANPDITYSDDMAAARDVYQQADAMLAAREKETQR